MVMHSSNTIDILRDSLNNKVEYMRKNIESFQGYLDHIISSIYDNNYNIETIEKLSNMIDRYYYSINQNEEVFNEQNEIFNDSGDVDFIQGNSDNDIDDHLKGMMEASSSENEEESESNNSDTSESEEENEYKNESVNIKMKAQDKFKVFSENIQNNCVDRKVFNLYESDDKYFEDYNSYLGNTSYGRIKIGN